MGEKTLTDLSKLVIDILLPFYLFFTTANNASIDALVKAPKLLVAGLVVPPISLLIAPLVYKPLRLTEKRQNIFTFLILLANTAFLGIPICEALFGPSGAFYAVIYDFGLTIIVFTFGIWLLSGGKFGDWRSMLFNPLLISVLVGLIVSTTRFEFPIWLMSPLSTIGQATLPIALLVAGAQIGNIRFRKSPWQPDLLAVIVLRLIVIPALVLVVFLLTRNFDLTSSVIIMESAMPVAVSASIMANRYQADAQFAASATLFSTLLSIITLPLLAWLIFLLAT
jgi:predicted permease